MKLKAVLFDHDGTLIESEQIHFLHWQLILNEYNILFTDTEYRKNYAGVPTPQNAQKLIEVYNLDLDLKTLVQQKKRLTLAYLDSQAMPLMPFVNSTIDCFLNLDLKLGIVTGADNHGVAATIKWHDLQGKFTTIVTGDDVAQSKPHPDVYLRALHNLGISAEECIAIEDTSTGVQAAVAAGIRCFAVPNDYSSSHDFSRADRVFANLDEIRQWVSAQQ